MAYEVVELSVRELVEFIMRSGSIDSRFGGFDRAAEGARIHRKLQKEAGEHYRAEVTLAETTDVKGFTFKIQGRADGIFEEDGITVIDEIKTITRSLEDMDEDSRPVHWAQAKCYGYIYGSQQGLDFIDIQLTYYQVDTKEIRRFRKSFSVVELEDFYLALLDAYIRWAEMQRQWVEKRDQSIHALDFPYKTYRRGQREMAVAVFNTIKKSGKLFCQAPTGIGKTLSTLFPSVKALGGGMAEKLFYLTAKTITRQAAVDAFTLMKEKGLALRTVTLTAKDKICFLDERSCNPDDCPYADGYFDRVGDVLYEVLQQETVFSKENIEVIALENNLCPFEFSLDLTLWCDAIICDYNYLFDPLVALKRFFMDEKGDYVFLVDEAHNLVDRAREMYSAALRKSDFLNLKRQLTKTDKRLKEPLNKVNQAMIDLRKSCPDSRSRISREELGDFNELLGFFCFACEDWQKKHLDHPAADTVLELYFQARTYLKIAEFYDEHYITTIHTYGSEVIVKQVCLDPALLLRARLACGRAAVLFSATLTPLEYFIAVLGGEEETPRYELPSPFDPSKLGILLADTISTRYVDREESYTPIAEMIAAFAAGKKGNYMAYFPSYAYLSAVYEVFGERFPDIKTMAQERDMDEAAREAFLAAFDAENPETLIGFCVMGGIYSEGIDLKGDRLIGTVIVGVGLPQIGDERNIIRNYYDDKQGSGFAYAYQFPGMNKVLQAVGRVIRDEADLGMVLFIDSRFSSSGYRRLFPPHLSHYIKVRNAEDIRQETRAFWNEKEENVVKCKK